MDIKKEQASCLLLKLPDDFVLRTMLREVINDYKYYYMRISALNHTGNPGDCFI